jgi:hypothetical protein
MYLVKVMLDDERAIILHFQDPPTTKAVQAALTRHVHDVEFCKSVDFPKWYSRAMESARKGRMGIARMPIYAIWRPKDETGTK